MQINEAGLKIIKAWEGLEDGDPRTVNLDPYPDPVGIWTIGWGHAIVGRDGKHLQGEAAKREAYAMYPGGITLDQAEELLRADIKSTERGVLKALDGARTTLDQFSAFVSLAFNIGVYAFGNSTLLKYHKAGRMASEYTDQAPTEAEYFELSESIRAIVFGTKSYNNAADGFLVWNKSKGKMLRGLVNRRRMERSLYRAKIIRWTDGTEYAYQNVA